MDLSSKSYLAAAHLCATLKKAGFIAYFVGGWVRDYLLGMPARSDIDIATSAPPEVTCRLFAKTIPVGMRFASVVVVLDGMSFEVTTFRSEGSYADGRHPDHIEFSSPKEDAIRRDFTVNGMFYDPENQSVIDYVEGKKDLNDGVIRAIGVPEERFKEDRLRMLRAIRLAAHYNFKIEPATAAAIQHQASFLLEAVAIERVWQEFQKMAEHPYFPQSLVEMHRLGLLAAIFPELSFLSLEEIEKRVAPIAQFPKEAGTLLKLMRLFPGKPVDQMEALGRYLRVPTKEIDLVKFCRMHCQDDLKASAKWDKIQCAYFYAHPYSVICIQVACAALPPEEQKAFLDQHRQRQENLQRAIDRLVSRKPVVNALRLAEEGVASGPGMGALLQRAEEIAILQDLDDPDAVLQELKKTPLWQALH